MSSSPTPSTQTSTTGPPRARGATSRRAPDTSRRLAICVPSSPDATASSATPAPPSSTTTTPTPSLLRASARQANHSSPFLPPSGASPSSPRPTGAWSPAPKPNSSLSRGKPSGPGSPPRAPATSSPAATPSLLPAPWSRSPPTATSPTGMRSASRSRPWPTVWRPQRAPPRRHNEPPHGRHGLRRKTRLTFCQRLHQSFERGPVGHNMPAFGALLQRVVWRLQQGHRHGVLVVGEV